MSLNFPTSQKEVFNRVSADIQGELPKAGPFLKNSFVLALSVAYSGRIYDNYALLQQILKQMFPDTATGTFLDRWGSYVNCFRLPSTGSVGNLTLTGLIANSIPLGTEIQTADGNSYLTTTDASIGLQLFNITNLVRSGNTVTATTASNHNLATGMLAEIAGADQTAYNGEYTLTVTAANQFLYTITGGATPTTPATGSITVFFYGASVAVESVDLGLITNLEQGTQLSLITPLTGINTEAFVQYGGIVGGFDSELDVDYRKRVIYRYQNPVALFNEAAIVANCQEVQGVTRVFVKPCTPYVGSVTVYFTRDNDTNIIPTSQHVIIVKNNLLTIKPANTLASDVFVYAPTAVPVDFTFTDLNPNTVTMQNAIKASLEDLFRQETEVGEDLLRAAYESAIYQTVDLETGAIVKSFTLSNPTDNISINDGELPTLGSVTFT